MRSGVLRFLNPDGVDEDEPAWSPDGTRLAYTVFERPYWNLYVARVNVTYQSLISNDARYLSNEIKINGPPGSRYSAWSPDGSQLAFIARDDIYITSMNNLRTRQLTAIEMVGYPLVWSPSGTHIVFVTRGGISNNEIYTVNVETGAVLNLSRHPRFDGSPIWSPDGSHIAFMSDRDGDNDIYVMDGIGGNVTALTDNAWGDSGPRWSPDGKWLLYVSNRGGGTDIYRVHTTGGASQRLTYTLDDYSPEWRPGS